MSIYWSQITDAEVAAGQHPTSLLFTKLVNNPRAVAYGDETVPLAKRILAEAMKDPGSGGVGAFILSDGQGGVVCGPPITFPEWCYGLLTTLSPTLIPSAAFPYTGYYTLTLWGGGGGGATSAASGSGFGSTNNGGGSGGYVRAVVFIDITKTLPTYKVGGAGATNANGGDTYVVAGDSSWRLDAFGGTAGLPVKGLAGIGKGGRASIAGFAQGRAIPGGTSRMGMGGRPALTSSNITGLLAGRGAGGPYNAAGQAGAILIERGAHA